MARLASEQGKDVWGCGGSMDRRTLAQKIAGHGPDDPRVVQTTFREHLIGGDFAGYCGVIEKIKAWIESDCQSVHGPIAVHIEISEGRLGMDKQDTESADVSEAGNDSQILVLATILDHSAGTSFTSKEPGVVLREHRIKGTPDTLITVGLDLARWRKIPAGSDEGKEVADDSPESDSLDGAG